MHQKACDQHLPPGVVSHSWNAKESETHFQCNFLVQNGPTKKHMTNTHPLRCEAAAGIRSDVSPVFAVTCWRRIRSARKPTINVHPREREATAGTGREVNLVFSVTVWCWVHQGAAHHSHPFPGLMGQSWKAKGSEPNLRCDLLMQKRAQHRAHYWYPSLGVAGRNWDAYEEEEKRA